MDYDFSFFLALATVLTGAIWGGYALWYRFRPPVASSASSEPLLLEYAKSFFPIVLIVLLLRSFLVEPFRIPSGSMMPTLLVGDFILVNKYTYGLRLPVFNNKIVERGEPSRGDIVVFRFPKDPTVDYIKRVIGLPGDRIGYYHKQIYLNGQPVKQTPIGVYEGNGQQEGNLGGELLLSEDLAGITHDILVTKVAPPLKEGEYIVPPGQYFVMGDNRDNSNDSRFWGFVPEENLVGKAFFIWMSWDATKPGVAFHRLGTILN
jgi:signal peptidase I